MSRTITRLPRVLASALIAAGSLAILSPAQASNSFLKEWLEQYPESATGNASCATCHGSSTGNLNAYGRDLCLQLNGIKPASVKPYLSAIEPLDSDGESSSNLAEINANAQPGWTVVNPLYFTSNGGCLATGASIATPSNVPLPHDPPTFGDPVAVAGSLPYSGYVNVPVTFDGSASYDSDGGALVSYSWDFGDGATGSGMTTQHTYAEAGTYLVSLTVVDDEGASNTNSTTATISAGAVLDLDIAALTVTRSVKVGKPIAIQLSVTNPGPVLGQAMATVEGWQNGVKVYGWQLNVYDAIDGGATGFTFPSYTPKAKGSISWTATIADVDPDMDQASATTTVK
jgi:PKD repeat protein